jgi:hypothetical protein
MSREMLPTPPEPFVLPPDYNHPDFVRGRVAMLDATVGRRPGTLGLQDEGAGLARDVYEIKRAMGRLPGTHGVDDDGEGILAHVIGQRQEVRRGVKGSRTALASAGAAVLIALASAVAARLAPPAAPPSPAAQAR